MVQRREKNADPGSTRPATTTRAKSRNAPRRGRDDVTEAMLRAAEELFARHGFEDVSVRQIAAKAGVSHALVHRYLGTKREILEAVLARHEKRMVEGAAGVTTLREAALAMLRENRQYPVPTVSIIARAVMDGLPYGLVEGATCADALIELARRQAEADVPRVGHPNIDPRILVAGIVALTIGWFTVEDWLVQAVGLDQVVDKSPQAALELLAMCLIDVALPEGEGEGGQVNGRGARATRAG